MKKAYKKKGSFWSNKRHLGRIESLLKKGATLAEIGLVFGVTRQGIFNVCRRYEICTKPLRPKKARQAR